ncbi:MFS transporter [Alicyclobacillus acidoterrestris]|nr:MFS transporter [Alicyclobacillus acidoterrestris]
MERSPLGNQSMLWALGLAGFLVNADSRAIAPMLPDIAASLHTTTSSAALLVTAYSIPYGLFQLVYAPIAEKIGKMSTILLALCLFGLGTIFCGIIHVFSWLLVLRFITGMFAAGIMPTTLAQIGDRFEIQRRPQAIAFFMSFSTSGQAMGIVIGGLVAQFFTYRILFLVLGAACIPGILLLIRERREREPLERAQPTPFLQRYRMLLGNRRSWMIYGLVFCEGVIFYGGFTFLGAYGVSALHLSYLVIGLLTATYSVGGFVGSRTITFVLKRLGTSMMPAFGALLMIAGFGIIWSWASVTTLTIGFIILGFGYSYCHSTLQTFATDLLPNGRATAVSFFAFSLFLGSGLGPVLIGRIFDQFGSRAMLGSLTVGMFIFFLLCTVSFLRFRTARDTARKTG